MTTAVLDIIFYADQVHEVAVDNQAYPADDSTASVTERQGLIIPYQLWAYCHYDLNGVDFIVELRFGSGNVSGSSATNLKKIPESEKILNCLWRHEFQSFTMEVKNILRLIFSNIVGAKPCPTRSSSSFPKHPSSPRIIVLCKLLSLCVLAIIKYM